MEGKPTSASSLRPFINICCQDSQLPQRAAPRSTLQHRGANGQLAFTASEQEGLDNTGERLALVSRTKTFSIKHDVVTQRLFFYHESGSMPRFKKIISQCLGVFVCVGKGKGNQQQLLQIHAS